MSKIEFLINRKNNSKKLGSDSGQVSIFVALIFQVLFVFFAMMVNVGLLVHHKINLQNSVDLAAYYAAGKQAEMLNAVSHVNYQIRQSYKLLMFRYHQIGMSGMSRNLGNTNHPYNASTGQYQNESDTTIGITINPPKGIDTAFCLAYPPMSHVNTDENYCKRENDSFSITLPGKPEVPSGIPGLIQSFFGFIKTLNQASEMLRQTAMKGCQQVTAVNWMMLSQFLYGYKADIENRKKMIIALSQALSGNGSGGQKDFYDIEGESVRKGAYKTLFKNLTFPNQESLATKYSETKNDIGGDKFVQFDMYNSLANDACGMNSDPAAPAKWLSEVFTYFPLMYYDGECTGGAGNESVSFAPKLLNQFGAVNNSPNVVQVFGQDVVTDMQYRTREIVSSSYNDLILKNSLGFEKNPWCMAYVGISAKVTPKIPFSPLGDVTMTARAFAKPFGGRVGPWYGTKWAKGAPKSDPAVLTDLSAPYRVDGNTQLGTLDSSTVGPYQGRSHGRYIGDTVGVRSNLTMAHMSAAIHNSVTQGGIDINGWTHPFDLPVAFTNAGQPGDYLHWNKVANQSTYMRKLEILSVVPDDFDRTYYSIDPDFSYNYLAKIKNSEFYKNKLGGNYLFRADLGARMENEKLSNYSIRNQIEESFKTNFPAPPPDIKNKLTYLKNTFGSLLTSWQTKDFETYTVIDDSRFGKCEGVHNPLKEEELKDVNKTTPGSCKQGGRVGYSVKLVDGKSLLENNLMLGGEGVTGSLLNPPPDNF